MLCSALQVQVSNPDDSILEPATCGDLSLSQPGTQLKTLSPCVKALDRTISELLTPRSTFPPRVNVKGVYVLAVGKIQSSDDAKGKGKGGKGPGKGMKGKGKAIPTKSVRRASIYVMEPDTGCAVAQLDWRQHCAEQFDPRDYLQQFGQAPNCCKRWVVSGAGQCQLSRGHPQPKRCGRDHGL